MMGRRAHRWLAATLLVLSLGGCSTLRGGKLWVPEAFGFVPVANNLYIEAGADEATRAQLQDAMRQAKHAMRAAYGEVLSQPLVHACLSDQCLDAVGAKGTFAKVYGKRIALSRRGLNWHFIAHEWSHAEMSTRLGLAAWRAMPQWFDEGLAVALSEAPEHSEQHWHYLDAQHIAMPSRAELVTFKTLSQWLAAGQRYSDGKNAERRARGEPEIHALYATAGHEVRPWFAQVGTAGLLKLIAELNTGAEFSAVYTNR